MNDPGLDQPMPNAVEVVGKPKESEKKTGQEFLSLWWFPFPLLAGRFGPMASAFSICALVVPWIVWIPPGQDEAHGNYIDNPTWLTIVHAIQLPLAFISNSLLYLNMASRVRFSVAQPIAIVGWYISSIALIVLTGMAGRAPESCFTARPCIFTSILLRYIFSSSLFLGCIYDGGDCHREMQRSLRRGVQVDYEPTQFDVGDCAAVYRHIEDWEYLDAVYWADCTILTVGFGDFAPTTKLGQGLLFPFAIGGIIIFGLIVCSIRSLVVERGKVIVGKRTVEKQRQKVLRTLQKQNKTTVLTPICSEHEAQNISGTLSTFPANQNHLTERQRQKHEFELMRQVQDNAINKRRWISFLISGFVWFVLWLVSALIFTVTEEAQAWSYFDSVYFAYVSLLTIGYGDFHPESNSGKAFFVFWSLLAVPSLTILISHMGDTVIKVVRNVPLWIGRFAILPAEKRVKNALKRVGLKVNKRNKSNIEKTPDIVRRANPVQLSQESNLRSAAGVTRSICPLREREGTEINPKILSKGRNDRSCLLIKEISTIMKQVNNTPPRKYTFDEWAWYLELLGEVESDANTYVKPLGRPNPDGVTRPGGCGDGSGQGEPKRAKWSWIGERSPLMGNREESEWLLERLTKALEKELEIMRLSMVADDHSGDK